MLAEYKISCAIQEFQKLCDLSFNNSNKSASFFSVSNPKMIFIGIGIVILGVYVYYNGLDIPSLAKLNKKSQDLTTQSLENSKELAKETLVQANCSIEVETALLKLTDKLGTAMGAAHQLSNKVDYMEESIKCLQETPQVNVEAFIELQNTTQGLMQQSEAFKAKLPESYNLTLDSRESTKELSLSSNVESTTLSLETLKVFDDTFSGLSSTKSTEIKCIGFFSNRLSYRPRIIFHSIRY